MLCKKQQAACRIAAAFSHAALLARYLSNVNEYTVVPRPDLVTCVHVYDDPRSIQVIASEVECMA